MIALIEAEPCYIYHVMDFQEHSQIAEALSLNYGRLAIMASGSKRPNSPYKSLLQPFTPLKLTLRGGKSDLYYIRDYEWVNEGYALGMPNYLCGMYINELLHYLYHAHEGDPVLFNLYMETIAAIAKKERIDFNLRRFEFGLLASLGYAVTARDHEGNPVKNNERYQFCFGLGFVPYVPALLPPAPKLSRFPKVSRSSVAVTAAPSASAATPANAATPVNAATPDTTPDTTPAAASSPTEASLEAPADPAATGNIAASVTNANTASSASSVAPASTDSAATPAPALASLSTPAPTPAVGNVEATPAPASPLSHSDAQTNSAHSNADATSRAHSNDVTTSLSHSNDAATSLSHREMVALEHSAAAMTSEINSSSSGDYHACDEGLMFAKSKVKGRKLMSTAAPRAMGYGSNGYQSYSDNEQMRAYAQHLRSMGNNPLAQIYAEYRQDFLGPVLTGLEIKDMVSLRWELSQTAGQAKLFNNSIIARLLNGKEIASRRLYREYVQMQRAAAAAPASGALATAAVPAATPAATTTDPAAAPITTATNGTVLAPTPTTAITATTDSDKASASSTANIAVTITNSTSEGESVATSTDVVTASIAKTTVESTVKVARESSVLGTVATTTTTATTTAATATTTTTIDNTGNSDTTVTPPVNES